MFASRLQHQGGRAQTAAGQHIAPRPQRNGLVPQAAGEAGDAVGIAFDPGDAAICQNLCPAGRLRWQYACGAAIHLAAARAAHAETVLAFGNKAHGHMRLIRMHAGPTQILHQRGIRAGQHAWRHRQVGGHRIQRVRFATDLVIAFCQFEPRSHGGVIDRPAARRMRPCGAVVHVMPLGPFKGRGVFGRGAADAGADHAVDVAPVAIKLGRNHAGPVAARQPLGAALPLELGRGDARIAQIGALFHKKYRQSAFSQPPADRATANACADDDGIPDAAGHIMH